MKRLAPLLTFAASSALGAECIAYVQPAELPGVPGRIPGFAGAVTAWCRASQEDTSAILIILQTSHGPMFRLVAWTPSWSGYVGAVFETPEFTSVEGHEVARAVFEVKGRRR